jgi:hypothetical protein
MLLIPLPRCHLMRARWIHIPSMTRILRERLESMPRYCAHWFWQSTISNHIVRIFLVKRDCPRAGIDGSLVVMASRDSNSGLVCVVGCVVGCVVYGIRVQLRGGYFRVDE